MAEVITVFRIVLISLLLVVLFFNIGYSFLLGAIAFDEFTRDGNILGLNKRECIVSVFVMCISWFSLLMIFIKVYTQFLNYKVNGLVIFLLLISFVASAKITSFDYSYVFFVLSLSAVILMKIERTLAIKAKRSPKQRC